MDTTTTVHRLYGRWREQRSLSLPNRLLAATVHIYNAPTPIPVGLRLGDHVQVVHVPLGPSYFDVYDPQIVGSVEGVRRIGTERVALLVKNEREEYGAGWAVVSAPLGPGETPDVVDEGHLAEWMKQLLDGEVNVAVPKSGDVVVVDNLGWAVTPLVTYRFPDPKMRRRDRKITGPSGAWKPYA
ncbi:hypothetical protein C8T65DRAFT_741498 [Cerioporus squamosus]|nr:hypothetical protein C8T65DRAFT_741498 [Cerioporus squamosus]